MGFKEILYIQPRNHEDVLDRIQKNIKIVLGRLLLMDGMSYFQKKVKDMA